MRQLIPSALSLFICSLAFLSVGYTSCHKKNKTSTFVDVKCANVTCLNTAHCYDGICRCPEGLEGTDCGVFAADRYIGRWNVRDYVLGSTNAAKRGSTLVYIITITGKEGVYDKFYVDGLMGDARNTALECTMRNPVTHAYNPLKFEMTQMPLSDITAVARGSGSNPGRTSFSGQYIAQILLDNNNHVELDTINFTAERRN